jgi:hypothetical protein
VSQIVSKPPDAPTEGRNEKPKDELPHTAVHKKNKLLLLVSEELKNIIYEFLKNSIKLVPEELINLIEFQKNSTISVPEELRNFIYEFPKNSI